MIQYFPKNTKISQLKSEIFIIVLLICYRYAKLKLGNSFFGKVMA